MATLVCEHLGDESKNSKIIQLIQENQLTDSQGKGQFCDWRVPISLNWVIGDIRELEPDQKVIEHYEGGLLLVGYENPPDVACVGPADPRCPAPHVAHYSDE